MFLLYDGLPFQTGSRVRGIGRYAAGLLDGLRAVRPGWDVRIIEHGSLPPLGPELAARFPVRRFDYPVPYRRGTAAALQRYFADWVAAQRPDWVLHPSPFETAGAVPRYSAPRPRTAAVLYDLIPALFPDHYLKHDPATIDGYAARLRMTAGYDLLLAISQATADDAARVLGPGGRTVVNIRGAADDRFDSPPPDRRAAVEAAVRRGTAWPGRSSCTWARASGGRTWPARWRGTPPCRPPSAPGSISCWRAGWPRTWPPG